MKIRNVLIGLVAVGSLVLAGGCGKSDDKTTFVPSTTPSASPTPSPVPVGIEMLIASAKDFATTPYRYSLKAPANGADIAGSIDPTGAVLTSNAKISVDGESIKFDVITAGTDYFTRLAGVEVPDVDISKWFRLDPKKLTSPEALMMSSYLDPTGAQGLTRSIVTAGAIGDKAYKGTVDLTKAGVVTGLTADDIKALGDTATTIPFEATVDDNARLTTLKLTVPAVGGSAADTLAFSYSDFGAPVTATAPAQGQFVEAPAELYEFLNG